MLPFWIVLQQETSATGSGSSGSGAGCPVTRAALKASDGADVKSPEEKCERMLASDFKFALVALDKPSLKDTEVVLLQCHFSF